MSRLLFIFNPYAGKAQIKNKLMQILDLMVKAGYEVTVHPTQFKGDAKRVARARAGEFDRIV